LPKITGRRPVWFTSLRSGRASAVTVSSTRSSVMMLVSSSLLAAFEFRAFARAVSWPAA
jgi:hypothetical protein